MRVLAAITFLLCSIGCAHGAVVEKIDVDTYRVTCAELPLDRCLADIGANTCNKHAYFVARGISEVNPRGRSDAPDFSLSSEAIVRCAPGQTFGDQAKELMHPAADAGPATAPSSSQASRPASVPPPSPSPARVCAPGSTQACVGAGACSGGQACKDDGSGYQACDCGPSVPAAATGND